MARAQPGGAKASGVNDDAAKISRSRDVEGDSRCPFYDRVVGHRVSTAGLLAARGGGVVVLPQQPPLASAAAPPKGSVAKLKAKLRNQVGKR